MDAVGESLARALAAHEAGELARAEAIYRQVLAANPTHAVALHYLGVIGQQTGHFEDAVQLIRRAIEAGEGGALVYAHLAEALRSSGRIDEAIDAASRALAIDSACAAAHAQLGLARLDQDRAADAVECFKHAVSLRPDSAIDQNNLGVALERVDNLDDAIHAYGRAVELNSHFVGALNNLGTALHHVGRRDDAKLHWERALELNPRDRDARFNLGALLMASGDYARGWALYRERRQTQWQRYIRQYEGKREWDGSPLEGRRTVLYPEQGFGDVIQFARFIPRVHRRGGEVVLIYQRELVAVMHTVEGVAEVIADGEPLPHFDVYFALFALPMLLNITLADLPGPMPYLSADAEKSAAFAKGFAARPRPWIGVVWAGEKVPDPNRSCPLGALNPVLDLRGPTFFSLQKGAAPSDARLVDLAPRLESFAETAAVVSKLDLIITIDSAPAHLAGALAAPTCTLLPAEADWRWVYDRADSPWYPTMRLFRQRVAGDWSPPVVELREHVLRMLG